MSDGMKIPLMIPYLGDEIIEVVSESLRNERFIGGQSIEDFEKDFADFIGTKHAVAVSSGTAALSMSLIAMGIKPGDQVITTPATFIATTNSILHTGANPLMVDVDLDTYTIDPTEIKKALEKPGDRVKAIVPVHLYGFPSRMQEIMEIADEYGIRVLEDACQSHGAVYNGKRTGSFGHSAAFSFYTSKNMNVCGDGGMVTTDNEELAAKIKSLRDCGRRPGDKYVHDHIGYTARMNTVNAAIGRMQLKYLEEWNDKRVKLAKTYHRELNGVGDLVLPPQGSEKVRPVWHLYVIRTQKRDELNKFLESRNIFCGIHYPVPVHLQPAYKHMGIFEGSFPRTEKWAKEVLSIPLFPTMSHEQQKYVIESIKEFYGD